jgi:hypothetical protein
MYQLKIPTVDAAFPFRILHLLLSSKARKTAPVLQLQPLSLQPLLLNLFLQRLKLFFKQHSGRTRHERLEGRPGFWSLCVIVATDLIHGFGPAFFQLRKSTADSIQMDGDEMFIHTSGEFVCCPSLSLDEAERMDAMREKSKVSIIQSCIVVV